MNNTHTNHSSTTHTATAGVSLTAGSRGMRTTRQSLRRRAAAASVVQHPSAVQIHTSTQRSHTLNRTFVKKPAHAAHKTPAILVNAPAAKKPAIHTPAQPAIKPVKKPTVIAPLPAKQPTTTPAPHNPQAAATQSNPKTPAKPATPAAKKPAKPAPSMDKPAKKAALTPIQAARIERAKQLSRTNGRIISDISPRRNTALTPTTHATKKKRHTVVAPLPQHEVHKLRSTTAAQSTPKDTHIEHPIAQRAHSVQAAKNTPSATTATQKTARQIKDEQILAALDTAPSHKPTQVKTKKPAKRKKLFGFFAIMTLLLAGGGYAAYATIPTLSIASVNAEAGIEARYPGHIPTGYRIVSMTPQSGKVRIEFASTTNASKFTLTQVRSNWDSNTLLDNYVKQQSHGDYHTIHEHGITVYTYKAGHAAWVSGGLLYIIEGDATLSPGQLRKIAASVR